MIKLKSLQIKNCFGFGDCRGIRLAGPGSLTYILGRNSSGKTSLLNAIKYLEYGREPEQYPNFQNFKPTEAESILIESCRSFLSTWLETMPRLAHW